MKTKIMLDLETMGNGSNAAIIAIGAVKFNLDGIFDTFYDMISLESSMKEGLIVDPGTIIWWMQQSEDARSIFNSDMITDLRPVLVEFSKWIIDPDTEIWGNGVDFDNVVLANAYRACGIQIPWNFRYNRCYRTMKNMYDMFEIDDTECTKHCAIDDAKSQANHLIEILKHVNGFE
ncbi:MAG: 3'-5' exonuclease [Methylococcaceae bacterium]